jgi:surfeit locus 1 family protein
MDSLHRLETPSDSQTAGLDAWRELPRLLISRQWRWVTLGVIVIMIILIRLGVWQLDRLGQRRTTNALIASRIDAPPVELTGQTLDAQANEYRTALVTGSYDHASEIVLRNRSRGGVPGMHILTPLRIAGSEQSVLIDRGWVPLLDATPEARVRFAVPGTVTVRGILRQPQQQIARWGPRDQVPADGRLDAWFRADVAGIARQLTYPVLPFYIEQLPVENGPDLPHPQPNIEMDEGPHLSYAVQWFSFAAILVGGYAAFVVTRHAEQRNQTKTTREA